jgi:hypothetical protein
MKDFYEKRKAAKAVDDPNIRKGDPACWSCLTDEQRDTICEWYCDTQLYDLEKQEKKSNVISISSILALVPFAVAYAYHATGKFFVNFIAAWFVHWFVFTLFHEIYANFIESRVDKSESRIAKALSFIGYAAVGAFVSWVFLDRIYR